LSCGKPHHGCFDQPSQGNAFISFSLHQKIARKTIGNVMRKLEPLRSGRAGGFAQKDSNGTKRRERCGTENLQLGGMK